MSSPLENEIAEAIYDGMKDLFLDATLVHDTLPAGSPAYDDFDPGLPIPISYPCKAIVEVYSEYTRAVGFASQSDRRVIILNKSLAVTPLPNDRITIGGKTYTILEVDADPALATWTCKSRV
jgi:hypothetical protein